MHYSELSTNRGSDKGLFGGDDQDDAKFLHKESPIKVPAVAPAGPRNAFDDKLDLRGFLDRAGLAQYKERPKVGWKLFSPSTWKGLRDTAWGRKKGDQRHEKRIKKALRSELLSRFPDLKPKRWHDRFFDKFRSKKVQEFAREQSAAPDMELTRNSKYGMHPDDAQAWGDTFTSTQWLTRGEHHKHRHPGVIDRAAKVKQVGEGRMGRKSFKDLAGLRPPKGPEDGEVKKGRSRRAGEMVAGYPIMDVPDRNENKIDDGIPDIVRDVFAGTTVPEEYESEHQGESADDQSKDSQDHSDDEAPGSDYSVDEDPVHENPLMAFHLLHEQGQV
jgi:hypothetical protein